MRSHAVSIYWAGRGWKDLIWSQGEDWIDGIISNRFAKYCPVIKFDFLGKSTETRGGRAFAVIPAIPGLKPRTPCRKELAFSRMFFYTFTFCSSLLHAASPFSPQLHIYIWRGKNLLLFIMVLHVFWPYVRHHGRGMLTHSVCLLPFGSVCTDTNIQTHTQTRFQVNGLHSVGLDGGQFFVGVNSAS